MDDKIYRKQKSGLDKLTLRQRKVCDPEVFNPGTNSNRNKDLRGGASFLREKKELGTSFN